MISRQIRTNAVIAYFFLGWMFLLARRNPDFSDPFIRHHAKAATKLHVLFFVGYFLYAHFASRFFMYSIPLLSVTIDRIIDITAFSLLTGLILLGAYRASKGDEASVHELDTSSDTAYTGGSFTSYAGASERDRVIFFLSFIPFFGKAVANRYESELTRVGWDFGSLFGVGYIAYLSFLGFDSFAMIALFLYILLIVTLAGQFFFRDTCYLPRALSLTPSIDRMWQVARALPGYVGDILSAVFGSGDSLDIGRHIERVERSDVAFAQTMREHFTDERLALPRALIFIPLANIVYLPKILISRETRYVLAIGQGLTITLLSVIGYFLVGDFWAQTLLLAPILLGTAHVFENPFYRIPVVYELYALINTLSFWFLENTRRIQATREKEQSVSFKVQ